MYSDVIPKAEVRNAPHPLPEKNQATATSNMQKKIVWTSGFSDMQADRYTCRQKMKWQSKISAKVISVQKLLSRTDTDAPDRLLYPNH